jgi:hypothetical protein
MTTPANLVRRDSHSLLNGGWLTSRRNSHSSNSNRHVSATFVSENNKEEIADERHTQYTNHPLLCNMLASERIRYDKI